MRKKVCIGKGNTKLGDENRKEKKKRKIKKIASSLILRATVSGFMQTIQ